MRHTRSQADQSRPTAPSHQLSRIGVLLAALLLPLMLLLLAACGTRASAAAQPLHVGLVTSPAGLGNGGLNELTAAGLQHAEKTLGVVGTITQPQRLNQIAPTMKRDIAHGDNVIIGVGYPMERPTGQVAQAHPNVTFLLVDAMPRASTSIDSLLQLPNVASIYFNDQQAGALAGAFAALLPHQPHHLTGASTFDSVAIFAPAAQPTAARFISGFRWGVRYIERHVEQHGGSATSASVETISLGPSSVSGTSPTCQHAVEQAAANGARTLLGLTAACQNTAIQVANAQHLSCIGVYANANTRGSSVAGSVVERIDRATSAMLASIAHHSFHSGMHAYDLASGDIALAPGSATLSSASLARLHSFEQQLKTLQLVPPQYPAR